MAELNQLYDYCQNNKIFVYFGAVPLAKAVTFKHGDCFDIALDCHGDAIDEYNCLVHEMAHIATGAFYTANSTLIQKQKSEVRATRWEIGFSIPLEVLHQAMRHGLTEIWELADYFSVTEDFMRLALKYYTEAKGVVFS